MVGDVVIEELDLLARVDGQDVRDETVIPLVHLDRVHFRERGRFAGSSVLKCEAWDFSLFCRSRSFC